MGKGGQQLITYRLGRSGEEGRARLQGRVGEGARQQLIAFGLGYRGGKGEEGGAGLERVGGRTAAQSLEVSRREAGAGRGGGQGQQLIIWEGSGEGRKR